MRQLTLLQIATRVYYKLQQLTLLQIATKGYQKLRQLILLQIAKRVYYKLQQLTLLQIATRTLSQIVTSFITNCDRYYKLRQYNVCVFSLF